MIENTHVSFDKVFDTVQTASRVAKKYSNTPKISMYNVVDKLKCYGWFLSNDYKSATKLLISLYNNHLLFGDTSKEVHYQISTGKYTEKECNNLLSNTTLERDFV